VVGWLVADTFRQSLASGLFWVVLTVSLVAILVCLSVGIEGGLPPGTDQFITPDNPDADNAEGQGLPTASGAMTVFFGLIRVPLGRDALDAVRLVQLLLAGAVADTFGLLLALVWTAGFLPAFLHPGTITVFLAKPVPRGLLLLGKFVGVVAFVTVHVCFFVGGTWMALGLKTGVWDVRYLFCVPLFLLNFVIFFSFSTLLAVYARSTVTCVFGTLLFWGVCWVLNYARHAAAAHAAANPDSPLAGAALTGADVCYWLFPKPMDLQAILIRTLETGSHFAIPQQFPALNELSVPLVVLSSLAFPAFVLFTAVQTFRGSEY
jgi:ABC-type transport system involved in multi-copper enzyme maturation permease subunit